jgi:phage shock protein A
MSDDLMADALQEIAELMADKQELERQVDDLESQLDALKDGIWDLARQARVPR